MKNVLITGATSGIGLTIAKLLHQEGFKVYGTSRNPNDYTQHFEYELLQLDVTSENSVEECLSLLESKSVSIDILINNAGIGVCGAIEETSDSLAREQVETNFWGAVRLTRMVLPQMREKREGKIIFIGSLAGLIGVPYQGFYAASKHALEGYCKSLCYKVSEFNIAISVVEPGFHKTGLHHAFKFAENKITDYTSSREKAIDVFANSIENAPKPDRIAEAVLRIINSKEPGYSYRVGNDAKFLPWLQFLFYRLFENGARRKFHLPDKP